MTYSFVHLLLLGGLHCAFAAIYEQYTDLPQTAYDFVIIGGESSFIR